MLVLWFVPVVAFNLALLILFVAKNKAEKKRTASMRAPQAS